MLTADDLRNRIHRQPFVPFRVTTSSDQSFDIPHPDFAIVTRRYLHIGLAVPEEPDIPDRVDWVSILHINTVEDLPQPASKKGSNGTA